MVLTSLVYTTFVCETICFDIVLILISRFNTFPYHLFFFFAMQEWVLLALEEAGIFTSGGLIRDKVKFVFVKVGIFGFLLPSFYTGLVSLLILSSELGIFVQIICNESSPGLPKLVAPSTTFD